MGLHCCRPTGAGVACGSQTEISQAVVGMTLQSLTWVHQGQALPTHDFVQGRHNPLLSPAGGDTAVQPAPALCPSLHMLHPAVTLPSCTAHIADDACAAWAPSCCKPGCLVLQRKRPTLGPTNFALLQS